MEGHAQKCVERCCELAHKTVDKIQKFSILSFDDHQVKNNRSGQCGKIVRDLLSDCFVMRVFGSRLVTTPGWKCTWAWLTKNLHPTGFVPDPPQTNMTRLKQTRPGPG